MIEARRWPLYSPSALDELRCAVETQAFIEFARNDAIVGLEQWSAKAFGSDYAVATNSGTSALLLGYLTLGLGPGKKVLCPVHTFYGTVTSLLPAGLVPVLVDVDPTSLNIDMEDARRKAEGASALVVTHNWGNTIPRSLLDTFEAETGLPIVEDASHLGGRLLLGREPSARYGNRVAMSLGARKIVSGGAGGMLLLNDRDAYNNAMRLSQPKRWRVGEMREANAVTLGLNFRMSALSAILALDNIRHRRTVRQAWKATADDVSKELTAEAGLELPKTLEDTVWYKLPVISSETPLDAQALESTLRRRFDVRVDRAMPFHTHLPDLARQAAGLPQWSRLIERIGTIDLSREVARRLDPRRWFLSGDGNTAQSRLVERGS